MTTLTNAEKLSIVNSRIKSLNYTKYGYEIDLIAENARTSPSQTTIDSINTSKADVSAQITALTTEAAKYTSEEE